MRVTHFDRVDLRLDASSLRELANGHLEVDGVGARVGLYTYHDDKGAPFVELVPPETLFDPASLATIPGGDVTIRHPASGLVTSDTWRELSHGTWVSGWQVGDDQLGVRLRLKTPEAKGMVKRAIDAADPIELSPAYQVDVVAEPGRTEHGRHDGIQRGRVYFDIAILGPGEARGGSGCRLQLDGPVCAPDGCRVQLARVRQDSAPQKVMKIKVSHKDGRAVELDGAQWGWLMSFKFDAAAMNSDQIETAHVVATIEGEEPLELIMPRAQFEMMLESVGVPTSTAAAPAGMEEESEMVEQVEAVDAEDDDKSPTMDAIARMIDRKLALAARERRQTDARDSEIRQHAGRLNIDASDARHWTQIALDAIAKAAPELADDTRKLAALACKGDAVAEGRLRERLAVLSARVDGGGNMVAGEEIDHKRPDRADARPPWERGLPNKKGES